MPTLATLLTVIGLALAPVARAGAPEPLLETATLQGWVLSVSAGAAPEARVVVYVRSLVRSGGDWASTAVRADYPALARSLGLEIRPLTVDDLGAAETVVTLTELIDVSRPEVVERYARADTRGDLVPVIELYLQAQLATPASTYGAALLAGALETAAFDARGEVAASVGVRRR